VTLFLLLVGCVLCKSQYRVVGKSQTTTNLTLQLEYFGKEDFYLKPSSPVIRKAQFLLQCLAFGEFFFKITDAENKRFEVLTGGGPFPRDSFEGFTFPLNVCGIDFSFS
jgi:hypothetical protein